MLYTQYNQYIASFTLCSVTVKNYEQVGRQASPDHAARTQAQAEDLPGIGMFLFIRSYKLYQDGSSSNKNKFL